MAIRLLYLARHGEHDDPGTEIDDGPLTEVGEQQSRLLGERLRRVPFSAIHHSPLRRAARTAAIVAEYLPGVPVYPSELLRDCIPPPPDRAEMSPSIAAFFDSLPPTALKEGSVQAEAVLDRYAVNSNEDRHELIVTHNFLIGWFVRHALGAPPWRWIGLNSFNCGLTIIAYRSDRPAALVSYNDIGHLPQEFRGATPLMLHS